ncbi:MAG TPA: hypothetical protein ENH94_06490 [Phycisphaerales bacterium]|nr:hypothetical protein [Phycisphaerales bacterium]
MLKTLRITSILVAVAALAVVVTLVIFGFRGDVGIEKYLRLPGAVESFRELAKPSEGQQGSASPLVKEALAFALRIDPPPAARPAPKPRVTAPRSSASRTARKKAPPPPPKKVPVVNVKFKLVATCRYDDRPEKSLALLNLTSKGKKWFRQGEMVGHLVIHEIKDGSIVLYKDGQENSEISVPKVVSRIRSLLKSDQQAVISVPAPVAQTIRPAPKTTLVEPNPAVVRSEGRSIPRPMSVTATRRAPKPASTTAIRRGTTPAAATTARRISSRRVTSRSPTPRPKAKPETPEERKASIDKSISGIKDIMGRPKRGGGTGNDMEVWQKLLDSLEKDKSEVEKKESKAKKEEKTKK